MGGDGLPPDRAPGGIRGHMAPSGGGGDAPGSWGVSGTAELEEFVRFLEDRGMVGVTPPPPPRHAAGRDPPFIRRVQQYAYIAKSFGLRLPYRFGAARSSGNMWMACYYMAGSPEYEAALGAPGGGFDPEGFLAVVSGRTGRWVEAASLIMDLTRDEKWDPRDLAEHLDMMYGVGRGYTPRVLADLLKLGLVRGSALVERDELDWDYGDDDVWDDDDWDDDDLDGDEGPDGERR